MSDPVSIQQRPGHQLSAAELYSLLELRVEVFVVEQECPYSEIDGVDLDESTVHLWTEDGSGVTSSIRLLDYGTGPQHPCRIGRVVTRSDCRSQGLAARLMSAGLDLVGDSASRLEAQTYLVDFYAAFGFVRSGPDYVEDGIPHTPMTRPGIAP